ncbi:ATP-binding cassette domain-containing protein [Paludibaculum fermentans]|uniref:ATP-binding cassette domain-containing protein n=2 Tax=Paludibaculum fermentans TaxID=1473598 RepID=A0A7S7SNB7_PALFE|nr:ATP-binding cassette domain-containing protein [Paludibaculum fermentans]
MHEMVIETSGLSRRFGDRLVVDSLSLQVPAGSVYGFLGPNGAGKTTTIRMLLGLLRGHGGEIRIFGASLEQQRLAVLRRIGALVEAPSLYPHLTGAENLRHACLLKQTPASDLARVLDIVGLSSDGARQVKTYSLGMKQRLGLAVALLGRPELIILDEPTNGLDPAGIQEMRHLLRDMPVAHGVSVFLSSHLLSEVDQIATHIGIIAAGKLQFQGSPEELRARRQAALRIGLDRPEIAAELLRQQGWPAVTREQNAVELPAMDRDSTVQINRFLVERGFAVYLINNHQPTLEEMFFDLTQPA